MYVFRTHTIEIIHSPWHLQHYALLSQNSDLEGNSTVKRADHPTKPATDVFIHGWVYDIENGEVRDLGVSVGPPGKKIPSAPFAAVESAVRAST